MTQVRVQYFGPLREASGIDEETIDTAAATPRTLYDALSARYGFTLTQQQIAVAVNERLTRAEAPLAAGDTIVFIPPIAGG